MASVRALLKPYIPYSKVEQSSLQVFSFCQVHIKFYFNYTYFPYKKLQSNVSFQHSQKDFYQLKLLKLDK